MKNFILGILCAICLVRSVYSTNYCTTSCGTKHVGCGASDTLKACCPKGARIIKFSAAEKQLILDEHNRYRNAIASGSVNGFEKAARMAKMVWDDELEYLAGLNTRSCEMAHDPCRNTDKFSLGAGQNLAYIGASPNEPSTNDGIRGGVLGWYNEYKDTTMSDIRSMNRIYTNDGKAIGHFTQLVWSNSTAIGCGATRYTKNGFNNFLIACNYAVGNFLGWPVYSTSNKSGSGCKTGTDSKFTSLCTDKENINPNNFYQA